MTVKDIYDYLTELAPLELQEDWDNSGFLIGNLQKNVTGILLALDVTSEVIAEAVRKNCNLIISHHPIIFHPLKNIQSGDDIGNRIISLTKNDISVISMHTNLDKTMVNDVLIKRLGVFTYEDNREFMKIGYLENAVSLSDYIERIKETLKCSGIRYYDAGKEVYKIACLGGAGDDELLKAFQSGCDTYVTADIRHHVWLMARELGINLIDADHFNTEDPAIHTLCHKLQKKFFDLEISVASSDTPVICYG